MNKYTRLFIDECRVYLPAIATILGRHGAGAPEEGDLREGLRLAHSIKGMALYEQQREIAALSWAMEQGFERLAGGGGTQDARRIAEGLGAGVPALAAMVEEVETRGMPSDGHGEVLAALEAALAEAPG